MRYTAQHKNQHISDKNFLECEKLDEGMQMSLRSNQKFKNQIELDFEDVEANVLKNKNQVQEILD